VEGAEFDQEGPGGRVLVGGVVHLFGDGCWFSEKIVRFIRGQDRAGARRVDHGVDHEIGDVDAFGAEFARDRFSENTLRGLGGRKKAPIGFSAGGRRIAGDQDRALAGLQHRRKGFSCQVEEGGGVDPKILFEIVRIQLQD